MSSYFFRFMLKLNQGRKVDDIITHLASHTFSVSYTKLDGKNRPDSDGHSHFKRMVEASTPAENIVGIQPPN